MVIISFYTNGETNDIGFVNINNPALSLPNGNVSIKTRSKELTSLASLLLLWLFDTSGDCSVVKIWIIGSD